MFENPNLTTEEELGNRPTIASKPIIPGDVPAAPAPHDMPQFFSGSLAPQLQHDGAFTGTEVGSPRVPKTSLMPFGLQSSAFTNAAVQSTSEKTVIENTATPDDDTIKLNLQTGTAYTVQLGDLNKLISLTNNSGGNVYLPPVAGTLNVAITNHVDSPFNSGNTVVVGSGPSTATSTYIFTATSAIAAGDFLFLAVRNVSSHSDGATTAMSDSNNGSWSKLSVAIDDPSVGTDTLSLFYIRNSVPVAAGGSFTLTLVVNFTGAGFNPDVNEFWSMTGLTSAGASNNASGLSSGATFSSGGLTVTGQTTFISVADSNNGDLSTQLPAASQGKSWLAVGSGGSTSARFNILTNILTGLVNDVYTPSTSGKGFIDILLSFSQAQPTDIAQLTTDFFCYVENTGSGTFQLLSAAPIDGSNKPLAVGSNQGVLLVWDAGTAAWYTERGMGGAAGVFPQNTPAVSHQFFTAYNSTTGAFTQAQPSSNDLSDKNAANGAAGLDSNTKLLLSEQATVVDARTTTTEAITDSDRAKLVTFSNTSAVAATIAQAGSGGSFVAGWYCDLVNENTGTVTLTPTTSTIDGNATLVLQRGEGVRIVSDGTNYFTIAGQPTQDTPNDADVLTFELATKRWRSKSIGSVSGANASSLRGISIASSASSPGNQDVLKYNSSNNDWEPVLADGMEHGDAVWANDSAFFALRDDFSSWFATTAFPTSSLAGGWGSLGWSFLSTTTIGGSGVNTLQQFGGLPPHQGILSWCGTNTRQNYGHLMLQHENNSSNSIRTNAMALMDNVGWKAAWVFKFEPDRTTTQALFRMQKRSMYIGFMGAGGGDVASGNTSARPSAFYGLRFDTSHVPNGMSVTSVAAASGGSTVYTGSFATSVANAWKGMNITIRGCENAANNGTFACTASTTTTLTLSNASGVVETVNNGSGAANPASLNITAVANAVGGNTSYTVQDPLGFTQGANGGWFGLTFVVTGCTNSANNGTFTCVGSTATALILNNASGVSESSAANTAFATSSAQLDDTAFQFEVVQNLQFTTGARKNLQGIVSSTGISPQKGNWYRFEITCTVAGQLVMTLYDENNAVNATHTFTVSQAAVTSGSIAWVSNGDGVLRAALNGAGAGSSATASNAGYFQGATGTKVTISGLTSPLTSLNATWEIDGLPDNGSGGPVMMIDGVTANLNTTQVGTLTYYPGLSPIIVWGNDDSGNGGVLGAVNMMLDYFSLAWNKAIASPSTVPNSAKSRYW